MPSNDCTERVSADDRYRAIHFTDKPRKVLRLVYSGQAPIGFVQNIYGADRVGMVFIVTAHADKFSLGFSVVRTDVPASRAVLAGMLRRYRDQQAALPLLLVRQLAPELTSSFIQNNTVQAGFLRHPAAGRLDRTPAARGHVRYFQILDRDHRVIFAEPGGGRVQEILTRGDDIRLQTGDVSLLLAPVGGEFDFMSQLALFSG